MAHSDQPLPVLHQDGTEAPDLVEGLGESLRPEDGGLVQLRRDNARAALLAGGYDAARLGAVIGACLVTGTLDRVMGPKPVERKR